METKEHISFDCPYCSQLITFDENGSPIATNTQAHDDSSFTGLGGLRSTDATPGWRDGRYEYNSQKRYSPPEAALENGLPDLNAPDADKCEEFPETPELDEDVERVLTADLRTLGFAKEDPTITNKTN